MSVVQNLYQIYKIPATFLVKNDCNISKYTYKQAIDDQCVVAIGDNIIFQQIRYMNKDFRGHREVFNRINKLRDRMHEYKKEYSKTGDKEIAKKIHIQQQIIDKTLFVPEIINVLIDGKKSDFHKFRTKGFYVNGSHYVYLCSGSGQIRRNTATFIKEEYHDKIVEAINCGLDKKTSEFVLAKYSAYFALAFSSILWVRTPRVCVIKDFFRTLPKEKVDFIVKDENGKARIEEREMDLELNCADGQGLIDPEFAELWAQDMELPYTPCSFVARSCFVKGNLATFDFKLYAKEHGISTIRDKWGNLYNIDDIDVLLSESQFKTSKYYSSWEEYCEYANANNIHWGVARYNKRHDDDYVLANYQYIQSLEISQEDIKELIQPTVDWIQSVCTGDILPTLLYAFGPKDENEGYQKLYSTAQTVAMKAIVQNVDFLNDTYIQHKIYKNITESINRAKLGKIWVEGNYQFMVSDPVAQCQAALGLEPVGVLGRDEIWSDFWRQRGVTEVDVCRSPMIDLHEHNPSHVVNDNEEANRWLKYMNSGIILSTYDTATARMEDADFDGDIVLTTSNPYFIKGSHKDHNIITYEKGLAKPAKMTTANITATVLKGFGTGVGGFSNTATIMYAMAAIFNKPHQKDQHDELMTRIKLLREIVGQEIDRIKGADKPSLPSEWKKIQKIEPDDTPEERLAKMKRNAMVVQKKPYFFRYLYKDYNSLFKQFEASYNQVSKDMFGIKFKKLLKKEDKTPDELELVKKYKKYSPLITSDCTMNRLCRSFESIDFDIKFAKDLSDPSHSTKLKPRSLLPTYEGYYASRFDEEKFKLVRSLYAKYNGNKMEKKSKAIILDADISDSDDFKEVLVGINNAVIEEVRDTLSANSILPDEFLFYTNRISSTYASFNWAFAWDVLGETILKYIPQGKTLCPVRVDPSVEPDATYYLGVYYKLRDMSNTDALLIQKLVNSIFGDPEEFTTEELAPSPDPQSEQPKKQTVFLVDEIHICPVAPQDSTSDKKGDE